MIHGSRHEPKHGFWIERCCRWLPGFLLSMRLPWLLFSHLWHLCGIELLQWQLNGWEFLGDLPKWQVPSEQWPKWPNTYSSCLLCIYIYYIYIWIYMYTYININIHNIWYILLSYIWCFCTIKPWIIRIQTLSTQDAENASNDGIFRKWPPASTKPLREVGNHPIGSMYGIFT